MAKSNNETVTQKAQREMAEAEKQKQRAYQTYLNEEKVDMYLSPLYRAYFGNVMHINLAGVSICFRVDGSTQKIPQTFADEITARRLKIDAINSKQSRMADVAVNVEQTPGELDLH